MLESEKIVREQSTYCSGAVDVLRGAAEFLRCLDAREPRLKDRVISDLSDPSFQREIQERVRETASHFVWQLSCDSTDVMTTAWVNEYKDSTTRTPGYASSIHNHRYDFVSIVLSGGYEYSWYSVDEEGGGVFEYGGGVAGKGDVVAVRSAYFHRITAIQDNTMTFLLKFPAVRESSLSIDVASGRFSYHLADRLRVDRLLTALKGVQ